MCLLLLFLSDFASMTVCVCVCVFLRMIVMSAYIFMCVFCYTTPSHSNTWLPEDISMKKFMVWSETRFSLCLMVLVIWLQGRKLFWDLKDGAASTQMLFRSEGISVSGTDSLRAFVRGDILLHVAASLCQQRNKEGHRRSLRSWGEVRMKGERVRERPRRRKRVSC